MIKLIVSDMDGTLLNDHKQLPADFWQIEEQLLQKNILFAIASGRQFYNLEKVFKPIKDRMFFIADNGSYVFYKNEVLYVNPMERNSVNELIEIGRTIDETYTIVSGLHSAYIEKTDERFLTILYQHYERVEIVEDLTKVTDEILKITICDFKTAAENCYNYYKKFENQFKIAVSGSAWLDINHINCNKGEAIRAIQQRFGISYDGTVVFGDYLNDIEMMGAAKYSYAMKNAHLEITKISNFITLYDNNENGVTKTIRELIS